METKRARRWWAGLVLAGLVLGLLGIKAVQAGWFELHLPLAQNGRPALIFFTLSRGCDCQMTVVHSAEAQLAAWELPARLGLNVIRVDYERRPDLAQQYEVARAPAVVLLDAAGAVTWKQDVGLSDTAPLDLETLEAEIAP